MTTDCSVVVDTNAYSVPWLLIGERVRVLVSATQVRVHHGAGEVATHPRSQGRRQRITDAAHFAGVAGAEGRAVRRPRAVEESGSDSLLRPLEHGCVHPRDQAGLVVHFRDGPDDARLTGSSESNEHSNGPASATQTGRPSTENTTRSVRSSVPGGSTTDSRSVL